MEVYNIDYVLYVRDGEHEPKQITNFTLVPERFRTPLRRDNLHFVHQSSSTTARFATAG